VLSKNSLRGILPIRNRCSSGIIRKPGFTRRILFSGSPSTTRLGTPCFRALPALQQTSKTQSRRRASVPRRPCPKRFNRS